MANFGSRNLLFAMTQGETGKVLWFKFEPTNNQGLPEAVDLTDWIITITIEDAQGTAVINAASCVADPNQVLNKGEGTFTFSGAQAAAMLPGWYKGQIRGVDQGANEYIFPTTTNTSYFRVKVNEAL